MQMPASFGNPGPGDKIIRSGFNCPDLLYRHLIISYHFDIRVNGTDELIQVIGKAVVIINE